MEGLCMESPAHCTVTRSPPSLSTSILSRHSAITDPLAMVSRAEQSKQAVQWHAVLSRTAHGTQCSAVLTLNTSCLCRVSLRAVEALQPRGMWLDMKRDVVKASSPPGDRGRLWMSRWEQLLPNPTDLSPASKFQYHPHCSPGAVEISQAHSGHIAWLCHCWMSQLSQ